MTSVSYPRILMEENLGRPLKPYEDVHRIDGNKTNNSIENLEIVNHEEQQSNYQKDLNRGIHRGHTCSKRCAALYGRQEQIRSNSNAECGLNGEPSPNGNTVPIVDNKSTSA